MNIVAFLATQKALNIDVAHVNTVAAPNVPQPRENLSNIKWLRICVT